MTDVLPILAASALVGTLHMSAPDHWVTLCILGQRAAWSRRRLLGVGLITAGGHVLLSLLLGFFIVEVGLVFSRELSDDITVATGLAMLLLGTSYGIRRLLAKDPEDYAGEADQEMAKANSQGKGMTYFVILGGALSPDLSILPIFLLAVPVGVGVVVDTALVFALASILSLSALVLVGSMGVAKALSHAPAKYNDALVGFVVAAVGVYVLLFG